MYMFSEAAGQKMRTRTCHTITVRACFFLNFIFHWFQLEPCDERPLEVNVAHIYIYTHKKTDLEEEERDVVSDHLGEGRHYADDDQKLGVGRTSHDEQWRPS